MKRLASTTLVLLMLGWTASAHAEQELTGLLLEAAPAYSSVWVSRPQFLGPQSNGRAAGQLGVAQLWALGSGISVGPRGSAAIVIPGPEEYASDFFSDLGGWLHWQAPKSWHSIGLELGGGAAWHSQLDSHTYTTIKRESDGSFGGHAFVGLRLGRSLDPQARFFFSLRGHWHGGFVHRVHYTDTLTGDETTERFTLRALSVMLTAGWVVWD